MAGCQSAPGTDNATVLALEIRHCYYGYYHSGKAWDIEKATIRWVRDPVEVETEIDDEHIRTGKRPLGVAYPTRQGKCTIYAHDFMK